MDVKRVAKLANLPVTDDQIRQLEDSLTEVMKLVDHVQQLDTSGIEPTAQVTGQTNVMRSDVIDTSRMFSQAQALANAPAQERGFFKVKAIFE